MPEKITGPVILDAQTLGLGSGSTDFRGQVIEFIFVSSGTLSYSPAEDGFVLGWRTNAAQVGIAINHVPIVENLAVGVNRINVGQLAGDGSLSSALNNPNFLKVPYKMGDVIYCVAPATTVVYLWLGHSI